MTNTPKSNRKQEILQTLAELLQQHPQSKITTALLAKTVGLSEAALYRHFPSKRRMFESLFELIEDIIFSRISIILNDDANALDKCQRIGNLLLAFAQSNPGLAQILISGNLEEARLQDQANQILARLETQFRQILRTAQHQEGLQMSAGAEVIASMIMAFMEGHLNHFVRTQFKSTPVDNWLRQWPLFQSSLLHHA